MNSFMDGLSRYLDVKFLRYLRQIRIGIIGAGGLGSNCAMHLVRSGFSHLILVDPDTVEFSNLNRQHYVLSQVGQPKVMALRDNLLAINPDAQISPWIEKANAQNMTALFAPCHTVIEAVDEAQTKKLIIETMAPSDCLIVSASGMGGLGHCGQMTTRRMGPNLVVVGDFSTPCTIHNPPLSPGVGLVAAMQADIVLTHHYNRYLELAS